MVKVQARFYSADEVIKTVEIEAQTVHDLEVKANLLFAAGQYTRVNIQLSGIEPIKDNMDKLIEEGRKAVDWIIDNATEFQVKLILLDLLFLGKHSLSVNLCDNLTNIQRRIGKRIPEEEPK
jgi:hypothetical protein